MSGGDDSDWETEDDEDGDGRRLAELLATPFPQGGTDWQIRSAEFQGVHVNFHIPPNFNLEDYNDEDNDEDEDEDSVGSYDDCFDSNNNFCATKGCNKEPHTTANTGSAKSVKS